MKKTLTAVIAAIFAVSLTGCGEKPETLSSPEPESVSSETVNAYSEPVSFDVIKPYLDYLEGFNTNNPELMARAITPKAFIEKLQEDEKYEGLVAQNQRDITATVDYWKEKYGENTQCSFLGEVSNVPLTAEQLTWAGNCLCYTFYDVKTKLDITEGYEVTFTYKIEGSLASEESVETACFLNIADDGWKMLAVPAEFLKEYSNLS